MMRYILIFFLLDGCQERWGCVVITNMDVTVYNRKYDETTHFDTWSRTVLHGVHVYVDHKTAVTDNGLKSAEVYKIRIPADIPEAGQYLPPDQFARCGGYGQCQAQVASEVIVGHSHNGGRGDEGVSVLGLGGGAGEIHTCVAALVVFRPFCNGEAAQCDASTVQLQRVVVAGVGCAGEG